jgi:hypothetical protein
MFVMRKSRELGAGPSAMVSIARTGTIPNERDPHQHGTNTGPIQPW